VSNCYDRRLIGLPVRAQRDERIDACRSPRRNVRAKQGDGHAARAKRERIRRRRIIQQRANSPEMPTATMRPSAILPTSGSSPVA
jgi:hypothetical protein